MNCYILRRATALQGDVKETRFLSEWRDCDAYVLLGDPGAGKTTSFQEEAKAGSGIYISARDFIDLGLAPEEQGKTLFIDGLDTVGSRKELGRLRARLKELGNPRFRIACREHDWRGIYQTDLQAVAPAGVVQELHLEPLSPEEQDELLHILVPDVVALKQKIDELKLTDLFGNPLLLELMAKVVDDSPHSRCEVYEKACRRLVLEDSPEHLDSSSLPSGHIDGLMESAGWLSAILLLSGKEAYANTASPSAIVLSDLPKELPAPHAQTVLASKLFTGIAGQFAPRHRSIAEYLAAKVIASKLNQGLPLGRVLALMRSGTDVVQSLRGLLGWLAVHSVTCRERLVCLNPLSVVVNSDLAMFDAQSKRVLLQALGEQAEKTPWFRQHQWGSTPFAPLATPDMSDALGEVLRDHSTEAGHQALADCVFDALLHGSVLPELAPLLASWVEDTRAWLNNRARALHVWQRSAWDTQQARHWLDRLRQGQLNDSQQGLIDELLKMLYPEHLGPGEVLHYWPASAMSYFWCHALVQQSRPKDFAVLADAWAEQPPDVSDSSKTWWVELCNDILSSALENSGDTSSDERLYTWLSVGLDEHGFSHLGGAKDRRVAQWLSGRPNRVKALVMLGEKSWKTGAASYNFFISQQRLHGTQLPRDWLFWLLEQAADASDEEQAEVYFGTVARALIEPPPGLDMPTMEEVESWVAAHTQRWTQAPKWLEAAWHSTLGEDNWRRQEAIHQRKWKAEKNEQRQARQKDLAEHLEAIKGGTAPAWLMDKLASVYQDHFTDIEGNTPEERVQDFLCADIDTAHAAIAGLAQVLERSDLPSADDIFTLDAKGRHHFLQSAALLAAQLAHQQDASVMSSWSDTLLATLVAAWLCYGIGETPAWYQTAMASRADVVAPLLVRCARAKWRRKGQPYIPSLWQLKDYPKLTQLALQQLLQDFPARASKPARDVLDASLLSALHLLDDQVIFDIVQSKLSNGAIDSLQRVSWLVAGLAYVDDAAQHLLVWVGGSAARVEALGIALHKQGGLRYGAKEAPAGTWGALIELLAPMTAVDHRMGAHEVTPADERIHTVRALIGQLASDPAPEATVELRRLLSLSQLRPWQDWLRQHLVQQRMAASEASYVPPSPERVVLTLANLAPANQADLQALVLNHLDEIGKDLRGKDTSFQRLFWREDKPALEAVCRDLLLNQLRPRLEPLGIHLTPERRAANEKRADIGVECIKDGQRLAVLIEIKLEDSDELWTKWKTQLQALYTIDSAANGYGIYLVLWFNHKPRSTPEGEKPSNAQDLEERLKAYIPDDEQGRLAMKVLDLSGP